MKICRNPARALLIWSVRGYQTFISPMLPRSCKYYPSCSQYAIDALRQYGVLRGVVLAGWRLLRCNPMSRGGYDPVENQTLFCKRRKGERPGEARVAGRGSFRGMPRSLLLVAVLAAFLLVMPLSVVACSLPGSIPTTTIAVPVATTVAGVTTTAAGAATTVSGDTPTTTVQQVEHPGSFDKYTKWLQAIFFWVLKSLHEWLGISWSWAIVLLTVIIRVILVPLTWRQIKSMRAMQALQPQMKALQEKYKDDRQVLNQKMMEFYHENNVSPFGSCLPLLLQMPVFIGLFYMLRTAGRAGLDITEWGQWAGIFVDPQVGWLWIKDITDFDYVLMFLYIASQFVASWQMARKTGGQQKMIAYFMPVMVGVFMFLYKWPAGLFIYWVTSNIWTIAQQYAAEKLLPVHAPVMPASAKEKAALTRAAGKAPAASSRKTSAASPGKTAAKPAGKTPAASTSKTPAKPAGKSGGKTSGQETGQKGKATASKGQRADGGAGGPKSPSGT